MVVFCFVGGQGVEHSLCWSLTELSSFVVLSVLILLNSFNIWSLSCSSSPLHSPACASLPLLLLANSGNLRLLRSLLAIGYFYHHRCTIHTHLWLSHYFGPWWCLCGCIAVFLYLDIFTYFSCCLPRLGSLKTSWLCSVCGGMNLKIICLVPC